MIPTLKDLEPYVLGLVTAAIISIAWMLAEHYR